MLGKGRVVVLSSVSGGGKTSLARLLRARHSDLHVGITATSRPPRSGEKHGKHYYFYPEAKFLDMIRHDEFLEHAQVHGNYYGVPRRSVEEVLEAGDSILLTIDVQGWRNVKERLGGVVLSIFLKPPSTAVWEQRLRDRGTDSEEAIRMRLAEGQRELMAAPEYDYEVINQSLDGTLLEVSTILTNEMVVVAE